VADLDRARWTFGPPAGPEAVRDMDIGIVWMAGSRPCTRSSSPRPRLAERDEQHGDELAGDEYGGHQGQPLDLLAAPRGAPTPGFAPADPVLGTSRRAAAIRGVQSYPPVTGDRSG
jgi:hypothetical protein